MKIEIKVFFPLRLERKKTPENKSGLPIFLLWKFIAPIPTLGKM